MSNLQEIEIVAGKRQYIKRTLAYGDSTQWSATANNGNPVKKSETTGLWLYLKRLNTDSTAAILALSDSNGGGGDTEIEWIAPDSGIVLFKFGGSGDGDTSSLEGLYQAHVTVKIGTSYVPVDEFMLKVKKSITGNPVVA